MIFEVIFSLGTQLVRNYCSLGMVIIELGRVNMGRRHKCIMCEILIR